MTIESYETWRRRQFKQVALVFVVWVVCAAGLLHMAAPYIEQLWARILR